MTPGDRPDLPLAEEPHLGLRPALSGSGRLGGVQPADGPFLLEEEPALWPVTRGTSSGPLRSTPARPRSTPPAPEGRTLPATGPGAGTAAALPLLLAAALALRARRLRG